MRKLDLGGRLVVAFGSVAVLTAVLAAASLTLTWQQVFDSYVRQNLEERANDAAAVVSYYHAQAGSWDPMRFVDLAHMGLVGDGLRITVYDVTGDTVATNVDLAKLPSESEIERMGGGQEARTPVVSNGITVGSVSVSTLSGDGLLTPRDVQFRRASLISVLEAALLAIAGASVAGFLVARTIVRPIARVTETAARLRSGERARTGMQGSDAVSELGMTVDAMADAVEADREFERQLTADVAHELRTPLMAIQATVEAMQDGVLPADSERLGVVRDETVRLGRLADSILELSRLERGAVPFEMRRIDLSAAVGTAVEAHRALVESSGLDLTVDSRQTVFVDGDPDRLTQAIGNLIANAARYTPAGRVDVSLVSRGGEAIVSVADTGIGIAEDDIDRVFSRFWRADPARERSKGGVGIGLAVVKEIAERHGGRVSVESAVGAGSTFRLHIPVAGAAVTPAMLPAPALARRR